MRIKAIVAAACLFRAALALAAPPCDSCHREQARSQPATDMAWALAAPGANRVLQENPKLTLRRGLYEYTIETANGQSQYTVTDGRDKLSVPIRWAFGLHSQTWVLEYHGRFYESLVSYFAPVHGLDTTIGDNSIRPQTLLEAFGRELSDFETKSCFECHATRAVSGGHLQLEGMIPGVQCERCGGGESCAVDCAGKGAGNPAETRPTDSRGDLELLRAVPPHLGAGGAGPSLRRDQRALPTVPAGQQPVLRRRRPAHELHHLPRSASRRSARHGFLRCQMPGVPRCCGGGACSD